MNYSELICRVAAAMFDGSARLGVRLSPANIIPEDAEEIATLGRVILPPGTYIAVAAPGAVVREDERTCVATGDRAAELATHWRNALVGEERVLYVSARRLGKAGGLQDTLVELNETLLRTGLLAWCESQRLLPLTVAAGLREAGIIDRVDTRSLCRFVERASGQPLTVVGSLLPLLDLAADSSLQEGIEERLRANVRWVQNAAAGNNRGTARMDAKAMEVRRELTSIIIDREGASDGRLSAVNLGTLSNEHLASDIAKTTRSPRKLREPEPLPNKRPSGPDKARDPRSPARTARQAAAPDSSETSQAEVSHKIEPTNLSGGVIAPPTQDNQCTTAGEGQSTPLGSGPNPQIRKRAMSGPWTATMHADERGASQPLPEGLSRLVSAVLDGDGAGLLWEVSGSPSAALRAMPKLLRDPSRHPETDIDPYLLAEWRAARSDLMVAIGAASALPALAAAPYSVLGDDKLAAPITALVKASDQLLAAAAAGDADLLAQTLTLDTATIVSHAGERLVVLCPTHMLLLRTLAERLPAMARAAALKGPARSMLAEYIDSAPPLPARLPYIGGDLKWASSPMVTPIYGRLSGDGHHIRGAVAETCVVLCRLHPHARLCLTVVAETGANSVVQGVADALSEDLEIVRAIVYCPDNLFLNDSEEALVQSGRLQLEPLVEGVRSHLRVHSSAEAEPESIVPAHHTLGLRWRNAEPGAVDLGDVPLPKDVTTWTLVHGSNLTGAPRRPALVLARGAKAGIDIAVLSCDPRSAARELTPTYKALGVEKLTTRTIENLTRDLGVGAAGLVSLGPSPDGRVSSLLIELVLAQALGEDAVVAGLIGEKLRVLLGVRTGAFCLGVAPTANAVRIAFGVGLITRGLGPGEIAALERGLEVIKLANKGGEVGLAARTALARAVGSGWRRSGDAQEITEAIMGSPILKGEVYLLGPEPRAIEIAGMSTHVRAVTPTLLEQLVMAMRGA